MEDARELLKALAELPAGVLERHDFSIATLVVDVFRDVVYKCAGPKVAEGVPAAQAVEECKREAMRIPGMARAVELALRLVNRDIDGELRLLLERAQGGRPRAPEELRRLKDCWTASRASWPITARAGTSKTRPSSTPAASATPCRGPSGR
ncbi:MAG: hypothetical protein LM577_03360 [Thermoproteaceae archaeon]|nr:hypothetical protein [Thermoproteaceae archaeon]